MNYLTHTENELAAYVAGDTLATGLHAALADQEAELDRMRYLLKEAVDTLRYISTHRKHAETLVDLAETLEGVADVWLSDHAVEADNLTGA
jgi:hypothetical protein